MVNDEMAASGRHGLWTRFICSQREKAREVRGSRFGILALRFLLMAVEHGGSENVAEIMQRAQTFRISVARKR